MTVIEFQGGHCSGNESEQAGDQRRFDYCGERLYHIVSECGIAKVNASEICCTGTVLHWSGHY